MAPRTRLSKSKRYSFCSSVKCHSDKCWPSECRGAFTREGYRLKVRPFDFQQVKKRFGEDQIPLLDPIDDMKINEKPFKDIVKKISAFEARLTRWPCHKTLFIFLADEEPLISLSPTSHFKKAFAHYRKMTYLCSTRVGSDIVPEC